MSNLIDNLRQRFAPAYPIPAGMYHYISPQDDPRNYRLHLRIEPSGAGVLIVNASTVLHLNETAAEYAYYFVLNTPADEVARRVSTRYHVSEEQARVDYDDLTERILALIETPDLDPVTFLDFSRRSPFTSRISAPYRLDCALTYHLPEGTDPTFAPSERAARELSTEEWKTVLGSAWNFGIPHTVFTGGEPTLREDLPELIAHAESLGMVAGLLTDGIRLADPGYLDTLLQTGLDHLMLLYQEGKPVFWQALGNVLPADIFAAVHLTITPENQDAYAQVLNKLAETGVTAVSLTASSPDLAEVLSDARGQAASLSLELVWNLPAPYSLLNPVRLELRPEDRPILGGRAWLYVEPDGDVLPAQGDLTALGNVLTQPWEEIWKKG